MTVFESIKQFFAERANKLVCYRVISKEEIRQQGHVTDFVRNKILANPQVKDFFAMEFPSAAPEGLVSIDSMDSFVFDFYFLELEDKIIISDAERSFECGVEAFEGNGVLASKRDVVEAYLQANAMTDGAYAISKQTDADAFVADTITFVKVLQTLNNARPYPPYLLELDGAKEVVDVLRRAWIEREDAEGLQQGREVALFDNCKRIVEHCTCGENAYPEYDNKLAVVGVFFNRQGEVLLRRDLKNDVCDFAISDFVLAGENDSLEALQRAMQEHLGLDFFFGELAPAITTTANKVITDYYLVRNYEVAKNELRFDQTAFSSLYTAATATYINAGNQFRHTRQYCTHKRVERR